MAPIMEWELNAESARATEFNLKSAVKRYLSTRYKVVGWRFDGLGKKGCGWFKYYQYEKLFFLLIVSSNLSPNGST